MKEAYEIIKKHFEQKGHVVSNIDHFVSDEYGMRNESYRVFGGISVKLDLSEQE